MKCLFKRILPVAFLILNVQFFTYAQRYAVLAIDGKINGLTNEDIAQLTRLELQKFDGNIVLDKYDMADVLKQNNIDVTTCLNQECIYKAGDLLKVDYVLSGSINNFSGYVSVNFRIFNIKERNISNALVREYKSIANQTQNQIQLTLAQMLKKPYNTEMYENLKRDPKLEQQMVQAEIKQLNLSGPRMGVTYITGEAADILKAPLKDGGFNMNPLMFQIGYQFEKQYLNSGKIQALFEVVPLITGIDQNSFVPSINILNGLRNNTNGFEFGIGAVFSFVRKAEMFKHTDGKYYLQSKWRDVPGLTAEPTDIAKRFDSRGDPEFMTAIVIAVGKSFKSGNLNIPVNAYMMPQRDGIRFGVIAGFNTKK